MVLRLCRVVAVVLLLGALTLSSSGLGDWTSFLPVYVDDEFAGYGYVKEGTAYVPLRLVSEALGATVEHDKASGTVRIGRSGLKSKPERVRLSSTKDRWWPIQRAPGTMRFKDALVKDRSFSAEVEIDPAHFTPDGKPIEVRMLLLLYDYGGEILARKTVSIYNVSSSGGSYLLTTSCGPDVVSSCEVKYQTGWVPLPRGD